MNIDNTEDLLALLSKRIEKYTSKESTSVPYFVARQLMDSILYCIELAQENTSTQTLLDEENRNNSCTIPTAIATVSNEQTKEGLQVLYQNGLEQVKTMILETKAFYQEIEATFHSYRNTCYYDTIIEGMPAFFLHYNPDFDARNTILTLDYPLVSGESSKGGIIQIKDYLHSVKLEQLFLSRFPPHMIESILGVYEKDYTELIFNLCIPVLNNAIACMLLDRPLLPLYINKEERREIEQITRKNTSSQLMKLCEKALVKLIKEYYDNNNQLYEYLLPRMKSMVAELKLCSEHNCLERLFYDVPSSEKESSILYEDGSSMDDERLRDLIEEMQTMRHLSDKIILLKDNVTSLSDLKEFLGTCFFQGEYNSVFQLLGLAECQILKDEIADKLQYDNELYEWEHALMEYHGFEQ